MKFGKVDNPGELDLSLPPDDPATSELLKKNGKQTNPKIYIGCAKWNRQDLKGFYPRGTKDELTYYATQFNSIELNATFYKVFPEQTVKNWFNKTPDDFRFFPKVSQAISQFRRLRNVEHNLEQYIYSIEKLEHKLEMCFLQMHPTFKPKDFDAVENFIKIWPKRIPLAVEFRHTDWYNYETVANELFHLFEENNISNNITDTAGRRDLMHMRLTNTSAFIRYNGANHETDYSRLDDWIERLITWIELGIENIYFFVHQNLEQASPLLSAYLIEKLNERLGREMKIPQIVNAKPGMLF